MICSFICQPLSRPWHPTQGTAAQAETVVVNAGTPWAVRLPSPEPPPQAPADDAARAQPTEQTPASGSQKRRRRRPERHASSQTSSAAGSAPGSRPDETASEDSRSQRGQSAKMNVPPAEWEYSAGPEEAGAGREERRRRAAEAAAQSEAASGAAEEREDGDETPAYGPWIGKTKASDGNGVVQYG